MAAARGNRHGHRDATMILIAYRHGLRVSELVDLRWEQVEFKTATLHVRRVKAGTPSTHPILGDELRALRRLQREQEPKSPRGNNGHTASTREPTRLDPQLTSRLAGRR
jgi:integrase